MKFTAFIALALLVTGSFAQAASLKEIFQSIADATETGNGNGHSVTTLTGSYNKQREIAKLNKEANPKSKQGELCHFDVSADTEKAIEQVRTYWNSEKTASRLSGLNEKGLIRGIVFSEWDQREGDAEGCSSSTMKVYGVDGSVLTFDFNETD